MPLPHWSRNLFLIAACIVAALLIRPVQERLDERVKGRVAAPDLLYFDSPTAVKRMALGYESLVADFYWMRAIQYYGRREEASLRPVRYKNLAALLDITTTLDPKLLDAYRAGSGFLAEPEPLGAGQPQEALRLLDKGIALHPEEWRLGFDKGFVYFWHFKDFAQAGKLWLSLSRRPEVPRWMESLAATAMSRGGAVETAKDVWQQQYRESDRQDVRENAWNHLATIQVNEDLWTLEFFIEKYTEKYGRLPAALEDLTQVGFLQQVPRDPSGTHYIYDRSTGTVVLDPASKVRYLKMPFDYKPAFREKLARLYSAP
jgi:tetratricopeptide (TPR) repeat protein